MPKKKRITIEGVVEIKDESERITPFKSNQNQLTQTENELL